MCYTTYACPDAIPQLQLFVDSAAAMAGFAAWIPRADLDQATAGLAGLMLQDRDEGGKAQIGDFPAPQSFHAGEVQVFDCYGSVVLRQQQSLLEVEVLPLVAYLDVQLGKISFCLLSVVGAVLFAGKVPVCLLQLLECFLQWLRGYDPTAVADREEGFQAEIHTRYFGRRGRDDRMVSISYKHEVDVSQSVPLDSEGFDATLYLSGFKEAVVLPADGEAIAVDTVSCLFQSEALVLSPLAERRRPDDPARLGLAVTKERLIGLLCPLHDVLSCL